MIDIDTLKGKIDLLALAGRDTTLADRPVHSGGREEYHGPCPLPGCDSDEDGFWVTPETQKFKCRKCGRAGDAIDYAMLMQGLEKGPAIRWLAEYAGLEGVQAAPGPKKARKAAPPQPVKAAPALDWQAQALASIESYERNLWETAPGHRALDYLLGRGLTEDTIRSFRLGVSLGQGIAPAGITIPCIAAGKVWYVKVSYLPGQRVKCNKCKAPAKARIPCPKCGNVNKYTQAPGGNPNAIYNADSVRGISWALFVEGEFDAMLATQELGREIPALTTGSATNTLDPLAWLPTLARVKNNALACYDADTAGRRGFERLRAVLPGVREIALPGPGKDITDFFLAGGDLWEWIRPYVAGLADGDITTAAPALGASVSELPPEYGQAQPQALAPAPELAPALAG